MPKEFLDRFLSYQDEREEKQCVAHTDLLSFSRPLVVLGEPGSGKTILLEMLAAQKGLEIISAEKFVDSSKIQPQHGWVVIDGLDELGALREGGVMRQVLKKLDDLDQPLFILSCRAADWQDIASKEKIEEYYRCKPIILTLDPFDRSVALEFLRADFSSAQADLVRPIQRAPAASPLSPEQAENLIQHLEDRSLESLYHNPLTLELLKNIAASGEILPETRARLFEKACDLLWRESEHRQNSTLGMMGSDVALLSAGAICAAYILTGSSAISLTDSAVGCSVHEIKELPHSEGVDIIIGSRLFIRVGEQRFEPLHRVIAEYLGARWIAHLLQDGRPSQRILSMLAYNGTVPASLRGLHAWIAHHSNRVMDDIIKRDPYGVLRYGDAENFHPAKKRVLLQALKGLAEVDPYFRAADWGRASARSLMCIELKDDIENILVAHKSSHLRYLVLEGIVGSSVAEALMPYLRGLTMNESANFDERSAAMNALVRLLPAEQWPLIIETLRSRIARNSARLAVETLAQCPLSAIGDREIVEAILAFLGYLICPVDRNEAWGNPVSGSLWRLAYTLPPERLPAILDKLSEYFPTDHRREDNERSFEFADFAANLIHRALEITVPSPAQIWHWIPLLGRLFGYGHGDRRIDEFFKQHPDFRRDVQRYVLEHETSEPTLSMRDYLLRKFSPCLALTPEDAVVFLEEMGDIEEPTAQDRENWKDLVLLARTKEGISAHAKAIARRFTRKDKELRAFLSKHSKPSISTWEKKQQAEQKKVEAEKQVRWSAERAEFRKNRPALCAGEQSVIVTVAQAYLGRCEDISQNQRPLDRVRECLGDDLTQAVAEGFEAVLHRDDLPRAHEVALSCAQKRWFYMTRPIVAGLAERVRTSRTLEGIARDVLVAGWITLHHYNYLESENFAQSGGLAEVVEAVLSQDRDAFVKDWRMLIESQLGTGDDCVYGLSRLLEVDEYRSFGSELAEKWLEQYDRLPLPIEEKLINYLLKMKSWEVLLRLWRTRLQEAGEEKERQALWLSTAFVIDFAAAYPLLQGYVQNNPQFIWSVRDREQIDYNHDHIAWVLQKFRPLWPAVAHPESVICGDQNPYDARRFLEHLINTLAKDPSSEARKALIALGEVPADGYTNTILHALAQQGRAQDEAGFEPVTLERLKVVTLREEPRTVDDLQAAFLEGLEDFQKRVRAIETNTLEIFYDTTGRPRNEDFCRNRIVELMQPYFFPGILWGTEKRAPGNKRADIALHGREILLPVEVKPQWNPEVWDAAMKQLDSLYAVEYNARGRGVYLALWFGENTDKRLAAPPSGISRPETAKAFETLLVTRIPAERRGQIKVFVLDLAR